MNKRNATWIAVLLMAAATCWILFAARSVVIPFFLALVLAYFLDPVADLLQKWRLPRPLASTLVFGSFLPVAALLLVLIVPAVKEEVGQLQQVLPQYAKGLYALLPAALLDRLGVGDAGDLQAAFDSLLATGKSLSFDVVGQVAYFVARAFSSTLSLLLAVLGYCIIPIYLFYLLRDFDIMVEKGLGLIPPRRRQQVATLGRRVDSVLSAFIRGQLMVCVILAILYSIGLLVIGIDLALVIGILSGLAFIIPYLGTILGILFAGLMALVKFQDLFHPLLVLGWFGLVQALEGAIITPRIVGDRVGLHPLMTILAVLLGGELFGFFGLLFAVPVVASANVLARELVTYYRQTPFFLGDRHG